MAGRIKVIDEQPKTLRGSFPTADGRVVLVYDDPILFDDPDYAPGVMGELKKAWRRGDYFECELHDGESFVEQVASMAGYGSPQKAAAAAMRDYWNTEPARPTPSPSVRPGRVRGRLG